MAAGRERRSGILAYPPERRDRRVSVGSFVIKSCADPRHESRPKALAKGSGGVVAQALVLPSLWRAMRVLFALAAAVAKDDGSCLRRAPAAAIVTMAAHGYRDRQHDTP